MKKYLHFILIIYILFLISACVFEEESFLVKDPDLTPEITVLAESVEISTGAGYHDFGVLIPGNSSDEQEITIRNDGTGTLTIKEITVENDIDFSVSSDPDIPYDIEAGDTITASIVFNPHIEGDFESVTLSIVSDDTDESSFVYFLEGSGSYNGSPAEISVAEGSTSITNNIDQYTYSSSSPTVADDYSYIKKSTTESTTYTITNSGTGNLTIDEISVRDDSANVFSISNEPDSGTIVVPGGTATFDVDYTPNALESQTAWIKVDNGNIGVDDFAFYVTGTGSLPVLQLKESGSNFNDDIFYHDVRTIAAGADEASFTIENTGTVDLVISSVSITGAAAFSNPVTMGATTIEPGETSAAFTVEFDPAAEGGFGEILTISNDSETTVKTVTLRGGTDIPYKYESLAAWFNADDIAVADGADVSAWTDRISGNDAVPHATLTHTDPIYEATGINGQPSVLFEPVTGNDNESDLLYFPHEVFNNAAGMTMFMVYEPKSIYALGNEDRIIAWYDNSTGSNQINFLRPYTTYMYHYHRPPTSGTYTHTFTNTNTTDTPYLYSFTLDVNLNGVIKETVKANYNGNALTSPNPYTTGTVNYKQMNNLYIGNYPTTNTDYYGFHGYYAQILVFSEKLTSDQINEIHGYLNGIYSFY